MNLFARYEESMFSRGGLGATASRHRPSGAEAAIDARVALAEDDPDKTLLMTYIGQLVADGFAVWDMLDNGEIEVGFASGETYLLAETTILRLA
jgi:hypothetical protein